MDLQDKIKLDQIQQDLRRLRWQTAPVDPNAPPLQKGTTRRALSLAFGGVLLLVEGLVVAIFTWQYLGSDKGIRMSGSPPIESLHWDPFIAFVLCVVAGFAWTLLFLVPFIGPLVGVAISLAWGGVVFMASGSWGFGVFMFLLSLLMRMSLRITSKRPLWLAVLEWSLVVIALIGALAPFSPHSKLPGLGMWSELRAWQDTFSCGKELRLGPWKGQYAETPAFYAQRKACAAAKARARRQDG